MDIEAPIIPGHSAAGLQVGSPIEEILQEQETHFISEEAMNHHLVSVPIITRYRSAMVDLWVKEGIIDQIMVHSGYRGKLMNSIGLGSTIMDIETPIGAWEEDEEDNLMIRKLPGLCFEIEGSFPGLKDPAFRYAPIKALFVFNLSRQGVPWLLAMGRNCRKYSQHIGLQFFCEA
jgi:hypothetical protein